MKLERECLPRTLRVVLVNGRMHMNVTNTGQEELHLLRGQNIGVVDLKSAGYFHNIGMAYKDACMRDSFSTMKKNHKIVSHAYIQY